MYSSCRNVFLIFLLTLISLPALQAQDPVLVARDPSVFFDNFVINSSGGVYFRSNTNVYYQDGSSSALNPILASGATIDGDTLDNLPFAFTRPLMPMFNSDYVLVRGTFNMNAEEKIIVLDPTGAVIDTISSTDALLSGYTNPRFGLQIGAVAPTAVPGRNAVPGDFAYAGTIVYDQSGSTPASYLSRLYQNSMSQTELVPIAYNPPSFQIQNANNYSLVPFNVGAQIVGPNTTPAMTGTDSDDKFVGFRVFGYSMGGHSAVLQTREFAAVSCPFDATDIFTGAPITRTDPFLYEVSPINYTSALVAGGWADNASPKDFVAIGTIATNGEEPEAASSTTCDCDKADIDGDGTIGDPDDRRLLWTEIVAGTDDPNLDLNGDGKVTSDDEPCFDKCNSGTPGAGIDAGFTNQQLMMKIVEFGDPLPGATDFMMTGVTGVRSNANGVAIFTVTGSGMAGSRAFLYALDQGGLRLLLQSTTDLGDDAIATLFPPSNVNEAGQFALPVQFGDNSRGAYRFQAMGGTVPTPTPTPTGTPTPTPTPTDTPMPTPTPTCFVFEVSLTGDQEVPPVTTTGSGTAVVEVNTTLNRLSYTISFSDLSSAVTAAHIHGFSGPGVSSSPVHTITVAPSPIVGFWDYDESQEAQILAGMTYINLHTTNFSDGEIRGQIADGEPCYTLTNFEADGGNAQGFTGGALPGFGGTTSISPSGLCMTVPAAGDNFVLWASPSGYLELLSNSVYWVKVTLSTDQTEVDAIPLFFLAYDNFYDSGMGNNYGGFSWVIDGAGGASGIGRIQGRAVFNFVCAPNAVSLPQWNEVAFSPANDSINDMRLLFEVIDANASLLTQNDSGSIYVRTLEVQAVPLSSLPATGTPFDMPIASTTHFANNAFSSPSTTATIDDVNNMVNIDMHTMGDVRVEVGYFDPTADGVAGGQFGPLELFPVQWMSNTLYRARSSIRSATVLPGGSGIPPSSPVDTVFVAIDTATNELGSVHFTTAGSGTLFGAASPGDSGEYESYFYSHFATLSAVPDVNRLRPQVFFFNTGSINGEDTGGDPFEVHSLALDTVSTDALLP